MGAAGPGLVIWKPGGGFRQHLQEHDGRIGAKGGGGAWVWEDKN